MTITAKDVTKIAQLARIEVTEGDKEPIANEINGILSWIAQLNEVNTDNVEPLASVSNTALPWREDKVTDGHKRDAILANAPQSDYGCFVVPKVIE